MKNKTKTRSALVTSAISLLLCLSMLIGTTFAWFTDEVVSGMNTIAAGNLDVELLASGAKVDSATKLFDDVEKWEPGVVAYENLQVSNVGTLALKYQMTLNFGNENDLNGHKLSEVLKVAVIDKIADGAERNTVLAAAKAAVEADQGEGGLSNFYQIGELEAGETSEEKTVVIFWAPNDNAVDNLYNANNGQKTSDGEPLHIEFGVNLQATQKMSEEDSFGNDYDEFASILPKATVNNLGAKKVTATTSFPNGNDATEYDMDVAFQFLPNETYEEAQSNGYRYWHADYVIKADRDVPANSMALAGYYAAFCKDFNNDNWVLLSSDDVIPAGTEIRLVQMLGGGAISVNYEEICLYGNDGIGFQCGAVDLTGVNAGTTITVELRLYETTKAPDATSGTANEEVGPDAYEVVGKYSYTFGYKPYTVNNSAELATAIQDGWYDLWLNDGTYQLPDAAKGKTLTISGSEKAVIEHVNQGEDGMNYCLEGSTVTFNGLTIKTTNGTYRGFARSTAIEYNDCHFVGSYTLGAGSHTFNNCHFNLQNNYVWTWGGTDVVFDGCTFEDENGIAKAILVHNTVDTEVTVKNCTFVAATGANTWDGIHVAAVSIDPNGAHTAKVTFEGTNTVSSAFNGNWQIKYAEESALVTVVE